MRVWEKNSKLLQKVVPAPRRAPQGRSRLPNGILVAVVQAKLQVPIFSGNRYRDAVFWCWLFVWK